MPKSSTPIKGFFITGTDTGVGKTVITACLLRLFQRWGIEAGVMKPFETGVFPGGPEADSEFLLRTGKLNDSVSDIAPCRLETPTAPFIAELIENKSISLELVRQTFDRLSQKYETVLVEGVGGLLVPIKKNYFVVDLAAEFSLPLILVTRPVLGTINHTMLTLEAAKNRGLEVRGIVINNCNKEDGGEFQNRSLDFFQLYSGVPLIGKLPWYSNLFSKELEFIGELQLNCPVENLIWKSTKKE